MRPPVLICLLLLSLPSAARATLVFGCDADGGNIPPVQLRVLAADDSELGYYDRSIHGALSLPSTLQRPLADGMIRVEYIGADRRAAYGEVDQTMTVQFADLNPPGEANKHPEGRASNIPVTQREDVVNWTGRATFLTMQGILKDAEDNIACQWYCEVDLKWIAVPIGSDSFGALKSLYDAP